MNAHDKEKGWRDVPIAGRILEAGNAAQYLTGDWRSQRPVWDEQKCRHCLFCWVYCPDVAVAVEEGKVKGIDLRYCKGCGICARECPPKVRAIEMMPEDRFEESGAEGGGREWRRRL